MSFQLNARVDARDFEAEVTLRDGETLALLGPNGSGKSTLLAVAAGLLTPDRGEVTLDDRTLTRIEGRTRVQVPPHAREVALLAQEPLLFPHLSAAHNIAFGPRARGLRRRAAHAEAQRWLERIELSDLGERMPASLSGGQAQRVAIARALATQPRLLLLDEPMAALDVDVTPALRHTMRPLLESQTTILTTHDVLDALLLADRVAVIDSGRIVESGPTTEVLTRPRSRFAASIAGLNLLTGTWQRDGLRATTGELVHGSTGTVPVAEGAPAVAVFRPTAVAVFPSPVTGSPRNTFAARVTALEPHGHLIRVRADHLVADITPAAAAELALVPGGEVWFSVKATEVEVYAA